MFLKYVERLKPYLITLAIGVMFSSVPHAHADETQDYKAIFSYLEQIKDDPNYIDKFDKIVHSLDDDTPTHILINLDLRKLKALTDITTTRESSEFAREIYMKYDASDYVSDKQYGETMEEIVQSSAKSLDFSLSLEIVQQLRERTYYTPNPYLSFIIDRCLMEIYIESFDYQRALEIELKMLNSKEYGSDKEFLKYKPSLYNEIAFLYNRIGNGEKALEYLVYAKTAYEGQNLTGNKLIKAQALNKGNRGRAYLLTGDYEEAAEIGQDVLKAGQALKQQYVMALGHRLIGSASYHLGQNEKAKLAFAEGIELADNNKIGTMQTSLYRGYALTLEALDDHASALSWQKKRFRVEMEAQRLATSAREALNGAESRAFERYQEVLKLRQENESQREISERDNKIKKLLAVVAVIFGCFLYSLLSNRKKLLLQAQKMKVVNKKLKSAALHDPLTGLPNRHFIRDHLNRELKIAKTKKSKIGVVHIDLDHFKEVNDSYGHAAGDHMLVEISKRMENCMSDGQVIARIGGDEFLMIAADVKDKASLKSDMVKLLHAIKQPLNFEGITLHSSVSIGVSCEDAHEYDSSDLIVNSDLALYKAKQEGRGRIRLFEPHMRETLNRRKLLEAQLILALDNGDLEPYFQPQVNISSNKVIGAETLVRWNHETRGYIPPSEFLPVAESSGLMVRLGRHVMDKAIQEASKWHAQNIAFGRLSLNASASELAEDDFVDWLLNTTQKHRLPANMLSIEILETVMIKDKKLNLSQKLKHLRAAGIHIELDDFGTGYASLQQVKTEEIDRLKIDRSFIENMDSQSSKAVIVKAIVEMANEMNIEVIAEGAETLDELDVLLNLGCHTVQGFGVARPMSGKVIADWMRIFMPNAYSERQDKSAMHPQFRVVK